MGTTVKKQNTKQPAKKTENKPVRTMRPQMVTRSKTLSNGQPRPKKRR